MLPKLNLKAMMPKAIGLGAGTIVAGLIQGAMDKGSLSPTVRALGLIAAGAFLPGLAGKNPMVAAAGDGVMSKGIDALLKTTPLGSYVRGIDDNVYGADDDGVYGYDSLEEMPGGVTGVVAGPDEDGGTTSNTF